MESRGDGLKKESWKAKTNLAGFTVWLPEHTDVVSSCREFLWPLGISDIKLEALAKNRMRGGKD